MGGNPETLTNAAGVVVFEGTTSEGGGSQPQIRYFEFAHGLAGLTDGVAFYTPTVGDIVVDAWFSVLEAWDGMNPALADFGTFTDATIDGFYAVDHPTGLGLDLTIADDDLLTADAEYGAGALVGGSGTYPTISTLHAIASSVTINRKGPYQITTADPLKVVVSQSGEIGGDAPASATGLARLYMQIMTPAAFA